MQGKAYVKREETGAKVFIDDREIAFFYRAPHLIIDVEAWDLCNDLNEWRESFANIAAYLTEQESSL